jgi:hypothetical protein
MGSSELEAGKPVISVIQLFILQNFRPADESPLLFRYIYSSKP